MAHTAPPRMKRGLRKHPAPLDMSLLGVPGSFNPRRRSTARPSIKESVAALGLNYSLSSGGIPEMPDISSTPPLPRPLPKIPGTSPPRSPPNLVLNISPATSQYTTTDGSAVSLRAPLLTTPPNLARLRLLSLPLSPVRQISANVAIRPPPPSPSDPGSPLLTPAPARPVRRWGMTVFPQTKAIRRVSSAPASPTSFDNVPTSPTSIIAIKSPVEWRNSERISEAFSLMSPFAVSFPQETDVPPVPPIPTQWLVPRPSIKLPIPPPAQKPHPLPPDDSAPNISTERSHPASGMPRRSPVERTDQITIEALDAPAKAEEKQPRPSQTKADPKVPPRGPSSYNKRASSSMYRRENSVRRPNRRLMLKRDSGAPFAHHVAMATGSVKEPSSLQSQPEGIEAKESRRGTRRWSASRRFLQAPAKRAKETVVMMRKGKGRAEEKDMVAVIPQLRELKAPKRSRW